VIDPPGSEPRIGGGRGWSLLGVVNLVLAHLGWFIALPLICAVGTTSVVFLTRGHTAEARFVPNTLEPQVGGLLSVAEQFGVSLSAGGDESVDFYAELVTSRDLLAEVARSTYRFTSLPDGSGEVKSGTLIQLLEVGGESTTDTITNSVKRILDALVVRTDASAGIITVRFTAPWEALAESVATRILDLVNQFNVERRRSRAAAEREFLETRLHAARDSLRAAERALQTFLEENRSYQESARLQFEANRLQREVDLRQQVYVGLAQAYDQARLSEVRSTPVITVMDKPAHSARPETRLSVAAILGGLLGLVVATLLVLAKVLVIGQSAQHPGDAAVTRSILRRWKWMSRRRLNSAEEVDAT